MKWLAVALLVFGLGAVQPAYADVEKDCRELSDTKAQIAACTTWIASAPKDAERYLRRGIAYRGTGGDHKKAIEDFSTVIKLTPNSLKAYELRGSSRGIINDNAGAVADYTAAIALEKKSDPKADLSGYYSLRAAQLKSQGKFDAALADYSELIRLNPRDANQLVYRADIYEKKGDKARAIADYRRALEIDPASSYAKDALKRLGQ